ncbi:O-antigen ligase family protein [Paenibacillus oceani]|uniref:O-antigen ligase family protein n=1 Tax=Paenibacillus oceani TaxID=2772510 RepID=A0A927H454_9BACL|nr:O-antigen ligase family protein [Paenibacillus oceani]MBD2866179.1 O-antigen ligase family protein [Paenibacillus oceani]
MDLSMRDRTISVIFCLFVTIYPFLIISWEKTFYYTNVKAYYLIGFSILLCALISLFSDKRKISNVQLEQLGKAEWLLLLLLLLVGVSTVQSLQISLVGYLTEHNGILVMFSYALLFMIASRFVHPDWHQKIINFLAISASLCSVYGIAQHYGTNLLSQDIVMDYAYKNRSFSFFDNPDYFGAFLVLAVIMVFTLYLAADKRINELLYLFILCLLGVALLGSETRSAWLGSLIGLLMLSVLVAWKRKDLWKKWIAVFIVIILTFVVMNIFSQQDYLARAKSIVEDVHKIATNVDSNTAGATRWYIWKITLPLIKEYFWFGSGPNTFHLVFHPGIDPDFWKYLSGGPIYDVNNDYLHIALTLGVPALMVYLLFLAVILYNGFHSAKVLSGERQIIAYGCLAAITGYLVQAFFNISVVSVAPYFWIILGISYSYTVTSNK